MTLLASMDEDGMCQFASIANLARRAIVTAEEARHAVSIMESPDPDSSDPENEGRRLERVPGGWIVLNAAKYKLIVSGSESRRLARERAQRYRDRKNGITPKRDEEGGVTGASRPSVTENDEITPHNGSITQSYSETEADIETKTSTSTARALKKSAVDSSKRISQAVNPEADEDLSELAERIAVAHPRSQLKHLGPMEIPQKDLQAVVSAILLESAKAATTAAEAGAMLLAVVEELAAAVPRAEWHYLKPVTAYFGEFEYRRDPTTFKRSSGPKGGSGNGRRRGTEGNDDVLREAVSEAGHDRDGSEATDPEVSGWALHALPGGGIRQDTQPAASGVVFSGAGGSEPESASARVQPSHRGMQVLPTPSYPPRIQWPGSGR